MPAPVRIAVIGHVEHAVIGRLPALPVAGDIAHIEDPEWIAGGGGGIAFAQLARSPAELHLFTALGNDDAAAAVEARLHKTGAHIYAARRDQPHTRDLVVVTPRAERTIFVIGEPLHPRRDDPLPWDLLASCDAAYFTGQDPATLVEARQARMLVVAARRSEALGRSGVRADVVIGSRHDPRERASLADFAVPPVALVMTEGALGGSVEAGEGVSRFAATPAPDVAGTYGAGDSFAGALTWFLANGADVLDACKRAAPYGAAVLASANPLAAQRPLE